MQKRLMMFQWAARKATLLLSMGSLLLTGIAANAVTLTVENEKQQPMKYGLDYERLWYWYGSGLDDVPQWSVNDCDIDFIRTAMNSGYELTEGTYDLTAYTKKIIPMMTAMQNANPDIKWFASPRPLDEAVSGASWQPYPLWVTGASDYTSADYDFNATKCAEYMIRYLLLMKSYGFKISYMDFTNEWQSNYASGGRFAPDDAVTIKQVFEAYLQDPWPHPALDSSLLLEADDFPQMIGASAWNYDQGGTWISKFTTTERQNAIDIAGSHNTDSTGSAQSYADDARSALGSDAEIWNTEVHDWKSTSGYDEVTSFSYMTDAIRAGISGLSGWLAIGTTSQGHCYFLNNGTTVTRNVKYYIFKKLSNTSNNGNALSVNVPTEFTSTTALIKDDLLTVWVVNGSDTAQSDVAIDLSGYSIAYGSTITRTRWSESTAVEGVEDSISQDSYHAFSSDIEANSLYCFEVTLDLNDFTGEGLVANWSMDDASGSVATDETGHGFDGTITDGTWVTGIDGAALDFNGTSSRVSIPGNAFNTVDDQITLAMWIYGDTTQPRSDSAFYAVNASGSRILNVHLPWNNSIVYWDAGNSGYDRINKTATSDLFKDQWNHWVFTKNTSTGVMNMYVNGELWHTGSGKTKAMSGIHTATIGGQISSMSYDGAIDSVKLYNVELSAAEVQALYTSYAPGVGDFSTAEDIGSPSIAGSSSYASGIYTLTASGSDIYTTSDNFYYAANDHSGDGEIIARVDSVENINQWTKAGVMFRQNADADAINVMLAVRPDKQVTMQYRSSTGGSTTSMGTYGNTTDIKWLKLVRDGDLFTGYSSADGEAWTLIDQATVVMSSSAQAGLAVTSHDDNTLATAEFSNVSISSEPLGYFTSTTDIGAVSASGSFVHVGNSYILEGSGADIWNTADECYYASQTRSGDATIMARIVEVENQNTWSKGGVMFRETTDAGSKQVNVIVRPDNMVSMQWRNTTNGTSGYAGLVGDTTTIKWIKLERVGDDFSGSYSTDGTTWTALSTQTVSMNDAVQIGLAVTSHNDGQLCTASITDVSIE